MHLQHCARVARPPAPPPKGPLFAECTGLLEWIAQTFKSPYIYHDLAPWGIIDRSKGLP